MNGEDDHRSEENSSLGSWHPAHMPDAANALEIDNQLPNDGAANPLSGRTSQASSPSVVQPEHSPLDRPKKVQPVIEPSGNETLNHSEVNTQSWSAQSETGARTRWDDLATGESSHQILSPNLKALPEEQDTGMVNGISFQTTQAECDNSSRTDSERLSKDLGRRQGGEEPQDLGPLDRTNSFPTVPPLHQAQEMQHNAHAQSQVENIIEEDEEVADRVPKSFDVGAPQQTDLTDHDQRNFFDDTPDGGEDDLFTRSVDTDGAEYPLSPGDDEARYEEGLPLMRPQPSAKQNEDSLARLEVSPEPSQVTEVASGQDFFGEDADFTDEASFFRPKPLDRKTTSQVLDSLNYPPYTANHDVPTSQNDRPSLENISGGGIAVSSTTVVSQIVAERSQSSDGSPAKTTKERDEDLAAMWQAALDDDELLDDSEEVASQPASIAATQPAVDHQNSQSPVLQPVYGADGKMHGFDYPNSAQSKSSAALYNKYSPALNQGNAASSPHPNQSLAAGQPFRDPSVQSLSHSSSAPSGFGQPAVQQPPQNNAFAPPRPSMPKSAESFVDKSKGGYTSPYDLPMDVTRPKKRTNLQQVQSVTNSRTPTQPPPPPRSSSMYARSPPSDGPSPPVPSMPGAGPPLPGGRPISSNINEKPNVGSFFEELPVTKSRPPSSAGRYAPAAPSPISSQLPPRPEPPRQMSSVQLPPSKPPDAASTSATSTYQLVPPERHSPYTNLPQQDTTNSTPPQTNSRYSPAPGLQSHVPPPRNRYAASPGVSSRPPPSTHVMPFQPRTSSPLAQNSVASQQKYRHSSLPNDVPVPPQSPQKAAINQNATAPSHTSAVRQVDEHHEPNIGRNIPRGSMEANPQEPGLTQNGLHLRSHLKTVPLQSPPSDSGITAFTPNSESSLASSDPHFQYPVRSQPQPQENADATTVGPPRRSQTQSPGALRSKPEVFDQMKDIHERPTSAGGRLSPVRAEPPISSSYATSNRNANSPSHNLSYIRPSDGREQDALERWKGAPVLKFGFGGTIVTSFPKHIPRYATGHGFPMIKCNPGEIKLQTGNLGTLSEDIARFPGPLKSKGKKKELLEWLQQKIDALEKVQAPVVPSSFLPDPIKKHEEKVLLWKVMKVFVESDGTVAGNSKAESSVRAMLCPNIAQSEDKEPSSAATGGFSAGISKPEGSHPVADAVSPGAMESVRKLLLQGEREKAVWHAVDQRMWAHAIVVASTLDKSTWKQVLHEFTRLEVKTYGENTESLAALYEVFAGNWDESIDQLVPPSARAGLQMVSKAASAGPTRNALDGLDKWRETLALILSNRTQDDEAALAALGRLLAGYGRTEAAHLCLVFAKSTGLFGGTEDGHASVVLLGADHQQQPFDYGRDLDSILLTEVYEFVRSVLAPSTSLSISPHLQSYKLYHAMLLAEHGYRSEAQQYCDAILSTLKSTTKPSPYYHSLLFNALDDLVERLQQAPRDSSSWMSKPMDKVSGSMWKKFNNFIVGDESDTASVASGKGDHDAGPFARVAADTPSISRSGSSTDLYSTFGSQAAPPLPAATTFGSRYAPSNHYAPSGQYTPRSSLEQQTRSSEEYQRPSQTSTLRPTQSEHSHPPNQSRYTASPVLQREPPVQQQKPRYQPSPYISPKPETYLPTPPSQPEYMPIAPPDDPSSSLYPREFYEPNTTSDQQAPQVYDLDDNDRPASSYEPPPSTYEPESSGYQPPSSYAPYDPQAQDDQNPAAQRSPTKKKSFMDDDGNDDFAARAAAILKEDKTRKDKEADDAFRKAAEADAQKDTKDLKPKKSWFGGVGGWLGGSKKDDNLSQEPKAIKAKLGEESSFYYDKELKKWVNKKGPAPAAAEAAKPPPPKGPPSRAVSAAGGPPPLSTSRTSTPPVPPIPSVLPGQTGTPSINVSQPPLPPTTVPSGPPSGASTPARTASPAVASTATGGEQAPSERGPPSAPPSRPPTAVSGASSIDDLIGEPQARKGGTVRRGKKGRGYVDVMAK
ncbi:MAG: hypothetical protein Q9225_001593 [Loekoesia sp. 1 TL-2023]